MSAKTEIKIASKESVAFDLAISIAKAKGGIASDCKKFLDLYAECLEATNGRRDYNSKPSDAIQDIDRDIHP